MATPKQVGMGMFVIAWLLLLGLLYFFFQHHLSVQDNPNQQIQTVTDAGQTTIVLKRNRNNHYVMTGKINDHTTTFLLDTGATDVTLPLPLAKQLGLQPQYSTTAQTANGLVRTYQTRLRQLTLGGITLYHVRATINTGYQGNHVLLGMSALKDLRFTQEGDTLTISQQQ